MRNIKKHIGACIVMDIIHELDTNILHDSGTIECGSQEPLCFLFNNLRNSVQSNILFNIQDAINPRDINGIVNFE